MIGLLEQVETECVRAFERAGFDAAFGVVRPSNRPDLADFQCNGLLALAKKRKCDPADAAAQVLPFLEDSSILTVEFARPGFLNFRLRDAPLIARAGEIAGAGEAQTAPTDAPLRYVLDYGGPNLAKEMHVGHLRSSIIGQTLKTLLRERGEDVVSDVHLGDWGLQIGQLISQIEDEKPDLLTSGDDVGFDMADLQVWYPKASARSKEDEDFLNRARTVTARLQAGDPDYMRLWKRISDTSIESLRRDFGRLGVDFDLWYGESRYQEMLGGIVEALLGGGVAEGGDEAVVIRLPEEEKLPPLILRNSNGGFGYGATDLATLKDRMDDEAPDVVLYVVDGRQKAHFRQVFAAAAKAGMAPETNLEHIAFGTVNGVDGKPFKTRAGGVMRLFDLIETMKAAARKRLDEAGELPEEERAATAEAIALSAIKFGELIHDRESNYVFDIDKFLQFEGKTGPYIQYTYARLTKLLARAAGEGLKPGEMQAPDDLARALILCLDELQDRFETAIDQRKPHILALHVYKLANCANTYYQKHRVLGGGVDPGAAASHLAALDAARIQIGYCLRLLGIEALKSI